MEEKNQLNDIILNKGGPAGSNKKIILAVATLGVVLIVVIMLMSTLTPDAKDNLPQPIPLPVQQAQSPTPDAAQEPLFEEVTIIEEDAPSNDNLDKIAQRLKQESIQTEKATKVVPQKTAPKKVVTPKVTQKTSTPKVTTQSDKATPRAYYVQVGSFSKYSPNKRFLDSIARQGYTYKFHKVQRNSKTLNKVLVGPFYSEGEARTALKNIKKSIEPQAFLVKL